MHPAAVARLVMKRTDHCLLVGEGALRFAKMPTASPSRDLLTDDSRKIWLHWKETNGKDDDRFPPPDDELDDVVKPVLRDPQARDDPLLRARHARRSSAA